MNILSSKSGAISASSVLRNALRRSPHPPSQVREQSCAHERPAGGRPSSPTTKGPRERNGCVTGLCDGAVLTRLSPLSGPVARSR